MKIKYLTLAATLAGVVLLAGCNTEQKPNSPPLIGVNSFVTETDVAIMDKVTAQDADNDPLTFELGAQPANGSVTLSADGSFTYTPAAEFTGSDSFPVSVSDGERTAQGLVSITVNIATVSFLSYSRAAFVQPEDAAPLLVNGRSFTADASAEADYVDLLTGP
jgi:hypothetical protein